MKNNLSCILFHLGLVLAGQPLSQGQTNSLVIGEELPPALPVEGKMIAFVYDDSPTPGQTEIILDALKRSGMRATFSMTGKKVQVSPELARRIAQEGHEMANNTFSHADVTSLSPDGILSELHRAEDVIFQATGVHTRYFRPPEGKLTDEAEALIRAEGYKILVPTFDSGDWRSPPAGTVRKTILDGVTPGAIILTHSSFSQSVAEMPGILEELSKRGFRSYPVSELESKAFPEK
ncbi:MAG: polysaccharide deacetylase family protein [Terrimicrobiaceae bacterium]